MPYSSKIDRNECSRRHYLDNADDYKRRAKEHNQKARKRNRGIVQQHLLANHCVDCGESDAAVLDFDHVMGEKFGDVSNLARKPVSEETLRTEIAKCEIRCSNCHRRRTAKQRKEVKEKKVKVKIQIQLSLEI